MIGQKQLAAFISGTMFGIYVKQGNLQKAKTLMHIYEKTSGLFDKYGHIAKGYEIFIIIKLCFVWSLVNLGLLKNILGKLCGIMNLVIVKRQVIMDFTYYIKDRYKRFFSKVCRLSLSNNDKRMLQLSSHEMQNMQQFYNYARYQKLANKR